MSAERYSFVCANGCGVCPTRLVPFEYERTETLAGELVSSKCRPQVVSACCGGDVHAYDNQTDDWLELVDVRATPAPGAPGQEATPPAAPAATEGASRELQLLQVENAGLQSSVGHLGALVDELRGLTQRAIKAMSALHNAATPDDSTEDIDAIIPGHSFATFVNEHAALLHGFAHHADMPATQAPAATEAPSDINWKVVGVLIEAHMTASRYHTTGTSNWGAALYKALRREFPAPAPAVGASEREEGFEKYWVARADFDKMSGDLTRAKNLLVRLWDKHPAARAQIEASTGSWFVWGQDRDAPAAVGASVQSVQASLSDEQIEAAFQKCGGKWDGDRWVIEDADLHPFARTFLASSTPTKGGEAS